MNSRKSFQVYLVSACILVAIFLVGGFSFFKKQRETKDLELAIIGNITESEELILSLQSKLKDFSKSARNLSLPDWRTRSAFDAQIVVFDLTTFDSEEPILNPKLGMSERQWRFSATPRHVPHEELVLLSPLFDSLESVKNFKLKIVRGRFLEKDDEFETDLLLSGVGQSKQLSKSVSFEGKIKGIWKKNPDEGWLIKQWKVVELSTRENQVHSLFAKTNTVAIPSPEERSAAERCIQDELVRKLVEEGSAQPPGGDFNFHFGFETTASHPGVSVVDINNDDWDDFYLMSRWGVNQLFVNQKDGTFKEQAAEYGLDFLNHCTSAAFADFDNDGDLDVFIGRSCARTMYLENVGNSFKNASEKIPFELPAMATSVAVTDYNLDGLLDVFITTYGDGQLARAFLPLPQQKLLAKKSASGKHHEILNALGVPNLLLENKGRGRFDEAPESKQLEMWQVTLCSTWVDYDADGDPDVYVNNDFGPDALMRNDYPNGFVDVTLDEGHPTMAGFGMGATWADYDGDGRQDLYVSNMYSKAGLRISEQIEDVDPRFHEFTNGNRLYRHSESGFELTSGLEAPKHNVAKVGWSWGGQFADFDNNGYSDIYVSSGYFTAPAGTAREDDL